MMKVTITALLGIVFACSSIFPAHQVKKLTEIDLAKKEGVQVRQTTSGNFGILSFAIMNEHEIGFLCAGEPKIKILGIQPNRFRHEFHLDFIPEDFTFLDGRFFILADYSIQVYAKDGTKLHRFPVSKRFKFIAKLRGFNNAVYLLTPQGNSYKIYENGHPVHPETQENEKISGWISDYDTALSTVKMGDFTFRLDIFENGYKTFEKKFVVDEIIGNINLIGWTEDVIYLDLQVIIRDIPLKVKRTVLAYSLVNDKIIDRFKLPDIYFLCMKGDILTSEGRIYYLLTTEEKAMLLDLTFDKKIPKTVFPDQLNVDYHYNLHLPKENSGSCSAMTKIEGVSENWIRRERILENADKYEKIVWYCSENNTTHNKVVQLPDGSHIRTPEWVTPGIKIKVPYKWGGFTHIDNFNKEISHNKFAGDNYFIRSEPGYYSPGDTYCIGVDCSGFVSRSWELNQKYSTSTLPQISTQLTNWQHVQKGDIANRAGSHVMLIVENNPSGTLNVIHASGYDWRVSYATYDHIHLTGYVPRKYNLVFDPLQATRKIEKAWIISKYYGEIEFNDESLASLDAWKHNLYRKESGGEYVLIESFSNSELVDGGFIYHDMFLDKNITYTYKVESLNSEGGVIKISNEPTI